ncbi:tripartite tricarboxylate transporter permease [Marinovum algicola]|jgi:putative tricarboxylic transport membrane protein|uniref:Tricarboxylic transport membrane protein n=1 Tax=Marinovum algicola TaxID=42444 RepID=A0A975ZPJ1_9RHOB|nr:tripartite tricarboxylate transporter permease [Marinovum algicola]SEJ89460.1 putative tricarboxylic transport membrane protein [Marinovum algicola]SLN45572.1 Tripartite tricarboxylate transporter TctA family protein [Marinovum algicola]
MVDLATILAGFGDAFTLYNLAFVLLGVTLGQMVGAVPGIGPIMAMAIAIPFTFGLDSLPAIAFLVGVNKGGLVGGAVPAVLMNTPGTPDAAATALDGHPLAKQGKPLKATKMALFSSITGDTFSDIVLITVSAPLAILALKMGPIEVAALMIFAFSILAGLIGNSLTKGVIAAAFGVLVASVGQDPEHYTPRLIFGYWDVFDGLPLPAVAIGMLAMSEILHRMPLAHGGVQSAIETNDTGNPDDRRVTWAEYWSCRFTLLRGATIGTILGAMPGIGSTAAAFMSYAMTKASSKEPETFGKGNIQGIAASESANSAVVGSNLIPLLTLGIPGSVGAALIISAFMIHGMQPGPLLFESQGRLVYGLFGAMIMANFVNLWVGQVGLRIWVKVVSAPESIIFASAILLCVVGVSMATSGLFGVAIMLIFAVLGYLMTSFGYSLVIFIIAFFLGPRFEKSIAQALALTNNDLTQVIYSPVALALLILSAVSVVWFLRKNAEAARAETA